MRLSAESHRRVEEFFREFRGEPGLRLPPVKVYAGGLSRLLLDSIGMGAITFGRSVFVSPRMVVRDGRGRRAVHGWLLVHEAAHVLQYEKAGFVRFLLEYLRDYWRGLPAGGKWKLGGAARVAAYMAIPAEREAREAEHAYRSLKETGATLKEP
ncbi:MAG TPA: DUF4157 domain-containing protein [Pyrinomonadaceae bacterium]|nr:DUF4157 domain-containing protein [Pyrinomonadaceae bacterium]